MTRAAGSLQVTRSAAAAVCHIYRASAMAGPYTRINDEPIACSGAPGTQASTEATTAASYQEYTYTDAVEGDSPYFYKLEIVNEDGSSATYGPAMPLQWLVEQPAPIELASFAATSLDEENVRLAWRTTTELGRAGLTIHTASAADGPYTRIDESFTPSQVLIGHCSRR